MTEHLLSIIIPLLKMIIIKIFMLSLPNIKNKLKSNTGQGPDLDLLKKLKRINKSEKILLLFDIKPKNILMIIIFF